MRKKLAVALQAAGMVSTTIAGLLVHPVAGFTVAGVALIVAGVAVERDN